MAVCSPALKLTQKLLAPVASLKAKTVFHRLRIQLFITPEELLQFIAQLRKLSGGKPTGFKLAIGHPWEWFAIAKAMLSTGITPDVYCGRWCLKAARVQRH